jgi:AcrR family transcriptional regulator
MATYSSTALKPRKQPHQARSQVTVDAVFEATIQVLLSDGFERLTTTRVADRAGVSVGTLYQYYPNKHALLYAVLQRHLARIGDTIEAAAQSTHDAPLPAMVTAIVEAFVQAKIERIDEVRALYDVANELEAVELLETLALRSCTAISMMLATASSVRFNDVSLTSHMFWAALVGPTRAVLKRGAPPKMLCVLRGQLESLCLGYLDREALPL